MITLLSNLLLKPMSKPLFKQCVLATGVALLIASCDGNLNVDSVTQIDASTSLATSQGVQVALTGAYNSSAAINPGGLGSLYVYGGEAQVYADLLGDDREVVFGGTFQYLSEIYRKQMITTNTGAQELWMGCYRTINRVNGVLSALANVDESERTRVEGEALFIRGVLYFELVRFYGKQWGDGDNATNLGVPIVLKPTIAPSSADQVARNSVAEVYAQAINDLTRAETLLPATNKAGNGVRANKAAAQAILARLYLQQGNYAAARDAANRVITTSTNKMADDFANIFTEGAAGYNDEHIFRIYVDEKFGTNQFQVYYASAKYQGRGDMRVQTKHTALYDANDVRGKFLYTVGSNRYTLKWTDQFGDVPVVRITEMFLTRAECNVRLGTNIGAKPLDDINAIRKRAGAPALTTVSVDDVLKERHLELAFEGFRIHDLRRTRAAVGTTALPFNDPSLLFPIAQRELDANKKLVQNPGYN